MGRDNSPKLNIPMCAACVLLLLTMLSVHFTSGLYARYAATASGSDSARVAKFAVSGAMDKGNVTLEYAPDASGAYVLTVTNGSEVTVEYDVTIVFEEAVEGAVNVTLDGKTGTWSGNTLTFTAVGKLQSGAEPETHTIAFSVLDWSYFTAGVSGESLNKALDFTVNIHAAQVD